MSTCIGKLAAAPTAPYDLPLDVQIDVHFDVFVGLHVSLHADLHWIARRKRRCFEMRNPRRDTSGTPRATV